jgi:hypothetical protein
MSKAVKQPSKEKAPREQPDARKGGLSPKTGASAGETARYIAEFTVELSFLAQQARLDLLSYLLDMARLEAIRVAQDSKVP